MSRLDRSLLALALVPLACSSPAQPPPHAPAAAASRAPAPHAGHQHPPGLHMDFSDTERYAKKFDSAERDAWQRPADVVTALALKEGHVVADIGSGTGYFEPWLSRAVGGSGRVLALDVEPQMVEHLKQRAQQEGLLNVESRLVSPDDPGLSAASVDRILIVNTWHHIDARTAYAEKLARALKPHGEIWIVDFTPESDLGPPPAHRIAAAAVVEELARAGLSAQVVEPESLPKQYLVRAKPEPPVTP